MREKEVKVLNIDKEKIEKKLLDIGATLVKDENQVNYRFDTEDNFLRKAYSGYLRIRQTNDLLTGENKTTMTFKKNISKDKFRVNEETEVSISDLENMSIILGYLGYKQKRPAKKHRRSYIFDNILFEIDTWDEDTYSKPYLEIEVSNDESLKKAIKLLELDENQITTKSIEELRKD